MSVTPPALPENPYAAPVTVEPVAPVTSSGSNGPTLLDFINSGGRFYAVPYNFSIVVVSFRRTMGNVMMVSPGNWPMGKAIGATVISCLFGWWGFPFGCLVFTPMTLFQLWNGGSDVTLKVLEQSVGTMEAKRILSVAPKPPKPASIWIVRGIILLPVLLIAFFIFSVVMGPRV